MQVIFGARSGETNADLVAAAVGILDVQGLMEVSDEVEDEHERFFAGCVIVVRVYEKAGLVADCRDNAVV
jgi:hypothetical protein